MQFLPFHHIDTDHPCVVVDSRHPEAVATLSHWRGAPVPDELRADTSTEIAIRAVSQDHASLALPFVSNNHFDVDGFLGIWALMNPDLAMEYSDILIQAATIADFREYDPTHPAGRAALKLVCWINAEEKQRFYEPFGEKQEAEACVPKYAYFLPKLAEFLYSSDNFQQTWKEEFDQVHKDLESLQTRGRTRDIVDIHLRIIEHPEPLHYYALFSGSGKSDLILMQYSNNRYELEYKYISWVDTWSRNMYPRLPFDRLAKRLNQLETMDNHWWGNSIMDTGPSLRLGGEDLTKVQRYDHPTTRTIHPSSISPQEMREEVIGFYRQYLRYCSPAHKWTWEGMRQAAEAAGLT